MILFVDVDNDDHLDIDKGDDHATNLAKNGCYVLRVRIAVAPHWKYFLDENDDWRFYLFWIMIYIYN